ncbi:ribonuclease III, partial [Saccharata proteae CBS 121410]
NLPFSGILSRYSLSAETAQAIAVMPTITPPMTAVFAFQFLGCEYHPPVGDQTCLGSSTLSNPASISTREIMKRLRIDRWGAQSFCRNATPRPRVACPFQQSAIPQHHQPARIRLQSTFGNLPSPPVAAAAKSAKLAALHARIGMPQRVPLPTLARTLVDVSADPDKDFNNYTLSILGADLLKYFIAEHIVCQYPRLPMGVVFAADAAFIGPAALSSIRHEWGVEAVAEPGGEVDPGLLQFKRVPPGHWKNDHDSPDPAVQWRVGLSTRVRRDDALGQFRYRTHKKREPMRAKEASLEEASVDFVRAVVGAVYLHAGRVAAIDFITAHFLRRHLDISGLFDFTTPTRDLSRLCAREGFEAPIARLLSETGRHSRTPVFVVGVYSGTDKLGEGFGASLDEARVRAAAAALKSWYLYSPLDMVKPSEVESKGKKYIPNLIDPGEIIV